MDLSNFDVIECEDGYHIMLTDSFKSRLEVESEIRKIVRTKSMEIGNSLMTEERTLD